MTAIDRYLAELESCLRVGGRDRKRILAEVRDHLDDATSGRERALEHHEHAIADAVDAFGSPSAIATQFNAEAGSRAMRRAPFVAFTAGIAVFAGLLLAGRTQQRPAVPMNAPLATQVAFFVAVLAFQVAVVAGFCAASRALALWRSPAARDRQFVRRCAIISTGSLGVAAAGWAITLVLAFNRVQHPNSAVGLFGAAFMIGGAGAAIVATYRLRVNPSDDLSDAYVDTNVVLGLGENLIGFVRNHPAASCLTAAALSAWPAMAHAETTFTGALPWGLIQAATVVLAFAVLGPELGLCTPRTA